MDLFIDERAGQALFPDQNLRQVWSAAAARPKNMILLLTEKHVGELLDMEMAIAAVEEVLRNQAEGQATNRPRTRVAMPASQLHVMSAGDKRLGVTGVKVYTASRKGARFLVLLYDAESGDMLAMIEADRLGQMRTGAASGVATKYMAGSNADTVGILRHRLAGGEPTDGGVRGQTDPVN